MKIEIFGTGCAKCKLLEKRVREAVEGLGRNDIDIIKVEDIGEIVSRGIMMTPGLAMDGEIKITGKIPSVDEIKKLVEKKVS